MADFVRLPDGSLILTRDRPEAEPSQWEKIKAALSRLASAALPQRTQVAPFWIPQQVVPLPTAAAPVAVPESVQPSLPSYNDWKDVEKEVEARKKVVEGLGEFPQRMMASPLVEGKLSE